VWLVILIVVFVWAWDRGILARHAGLLWALVGVAAILVVLYNLQDARLRKRERNTKVCTACQRRMPVSEFTSVKRNRDGLSTRCRGCQRERRMANLPPEQRAAARERAAQRDHMRRLKEDSPAEYAEVVRARRNASMRAYMRRRRAREPGYAAEMRRRWRAANPAKYAAAKARERGATVIDLVEPLDIFRRDDWTCYLCGGKVTAADASLDHIVPIARGGQHTADNLACTHRECNYAKGHRELQSCSRCGERVIAGVRRCPWCGFTVSGRSS
jgi:hypothetical protein